jgi:membrane protease YdiL (CAAX protease family)
MTAQTSRLAAGKRHRGIAWFLLGLLLLLRIPFTIAIIYIQPIENQSGATLYEVSTYLLTAFLIWWERAHLVKYHIDSSALFLIVFFRPLQTLILWDWKVDSPLAFPRPAACLLWAIAIALILALWRGGFRPRDITVHSLAWLGTGILVGMLMSILENLTTFQSMLVYARSPEASSSSVVVSSGLNLLYHLGFAPINEEPLFRGFLWGYLRQESWNERWIWLFQALLFTLAHVYLAQQFPLAFWVFIPGAALVFGALAWRSRSISPAIFAHAMINGSVYLLISLVLRTT